MGRICAFVGIRAFVDKDLGFGGEDFGHSWGWIRGFVGKDWGFRGCEQKLQKAVVEPRLKRRLEKIRFKDVTAESRLRAAPLIQGFGLGTTLRWHPKP